MCCLMFYCNRLVSFVFYVIIFLWSFMKNILNMTFSCKTVEIKLKKSNWFKEVILISIVEYLKMIVLLIYMNI